MKRAIREHAKEFVAILALVVFGMGTTLYILANQQAPYPSWIPILGEDAFELKADLETAQAITPGQGQTVNVAGIKVGDITRGRARRRPCRRDDAGRRPLRRADQGRRHRAGEAAHGPSGHDARGRPGHEQTSPWRRATPSRSPRPSGTCRPDEFLAALDGDTRDYLKLLVQGGSRGLAENGEEASAVFRRFSPLAKYLAKLNGALEERDDAIRRSITSFKEVSRGARRQRHAPRGLRLFLERRALGVRAPGGVAPSDLPGAPRRADGDARGGHLRRHLRPGARPGRHGAAPVGTAPEAGAGGDASRFFRDTEEPIREQITPFARQTQEPFEELRKTTTKLNETTPVADWRPERAQQAVQRAGPTTRRAPRRATCSGRTGSATTRTRRSPSRTPAGPSCARSGSTHARPRTLALGTATVPASRRC